MVARFDPLSKRPLGIKKWNCPSVLLPPASSLLPHSFLTWQVPSFVASLLFLCCSNVYSTHECLYFRMNHLPLLRINSMLSFPFSFPSCFFFCALEPQSRPTISCVAVALLFYELSSSWSSSCVGISAALTMKFRAFSGLNSYSACCPFNSSICCSHAS